MDKERFIGPYPTIGNLLGYITDVSPKATVMFGPGGEGKSLWLRCLANENGFKGIFKEWITSPIFRDNPNRLLFVIVDASSYSIAVSSYPETISKPEPEFLLTFIIDYIIATLSRFAEVDISMISLSDMDETKYFSIESLKDALRRAAVSAINNANDQLFTDGLGSTVFDKLSTLLKTINRWGLRIILVIDDFDIIAPDLNLTVLGALRASLVYTSMVFVTRRPISEVMKHSNAMYESPLMNVLRNQVTQTLSIVPQTIRLLITQPPIWQQDIEQSLFTEADVAFVMGMAGTHFELTRASCEYLYHSYAHDYRLGAPLIPSYDYEYVRNSLLQYFTDFFAMIWGSAIKEHQDIQVQLKTIKFLLRLCESPVENLPPELRYLHEDGIVKRRHGKYELFAGLFKDYIELIYSQDSLVLPHEIAALDGVMLEKDQFTPLEQAILETLARSDNSPVDSETLIFSVYHVSPNSAEYSDYENRLRTTISRLRSKLAAVGNIENVRQKGYTLALSPLPDWMLYSA